MEAVRWARLSAHQVHFGGPLRICLTDTREPLIYHAVCTPTDLVDLRQSPAKELRQGSMRVPRVSTLKPKLSSGCAKRTGLGIHFASYADSCFPYETIAVLVWTTDPSKGSRRQLISA